MTNLRDKIDADTLKLGNFGKYNNIKIVFQDESLTSVKAEEILRERKNFQDGMLRDGTLDSEAAALILSDYLESRG